MIIKNGEFESKNCSFLTPNAVFICYMLCVEVKRSFKVLKESVRPLNILGQSFTTFINNSKLSKHGDMNDQESKWEKNPPYEGAEHPHEK